MTDSDEMILDIIDLSRGGSGVGRHPDGRVVFVPFTAPGDQIRARIVGRSKNYAHGQLIEIIRKSENRETPRCQAFTRCGGCQWQHISYEVQWKTKFTGVKQAYARQSLNEWGAWEEIPADQPWDYRNRVQLRGFKEKLGFFEPGTNEIVAVDRCDIARPEINAAWADVRAEGMKQLAPYKVEVEVLPDGSLRKVWNASHAAMGFRQVHDEQNVKLKKWVQSALRGTGVLFDLFGGSGNLSENLSTQFREIHCVDVGAPSRRPDGVPLQIHFHKKPVLEWVQELSRAKSSSSDISVVADPPREGIGKDIVLLEKSLRNLGAKEWVLVGCDPDSWSRDLAHLIRAGWKLERLAVLDLFPQTHHVESLALLRL